MIDHHVLSRLPQTPGVYQFLNDKKEILYIGKAKNIHTRILQHMHQGKNTPVKNLKMLEQVHDIQWTETDNEVEALILENTLIKQHRPKYNILLRDDKNFLFVKISIEDSYPRITVVRRITDKKSLYFGPYTTAHYIRETLTLIEKIFPYNCLSFFQKGITHTPCFNYHIHRCPGLCLGSISETDYRHIIERIIRFLRGDIAEILQTLRQEMTEYSKKREFERAAKIRDTVLALQGVNEKQKVVDANQATNEDVIAYTAISSTLYTSVLKIRGGKLLRQENYTFTLPHHDVADIEMMEYIMQEYYELTTDIPESIMIPINTPNATIIRAWLSSKKGKKVSFIIPSKGKKQYLLDLCKKNALSFADKEQFKVLSATGIDPALGTKELGKILKIQKPIHRIECYDISHLAGTCTVASMIVFNQGIPDKKQYRQFKIHLPVGTIDDYQSLKETLERRLKYLVNPVLKKMIKDKKESLLKRPDLIIVDGGKGQLSIGIQVLSSLKLFKKIPIISIAKEQEEIYIPHQQLPLELPKDSQGQYLIERLRDESHRFAHSLNQKLRMKESMASHIDTIAGVGRITKKKLITRFGSLKNAQQASTQELEKLIGKKRAQEIKEKL